MILNIPLTHDGDRTISLTLGDNALRIRTYYNAVNQYWCADFATDIDTAITQGAVCKMGVNLIGIRPVLAQTYGLFLMDTNAYGSDSLGNNAHMYWLSYADYQALPTATPDTATIPLTYDFDALYPPEKNTK